MRGGIGRSSTAKQTALWRLSALLLLTSLGAAGADKKTASSNLAPSDPSLLIVLLRDSSVHDELKLKPRQSDYMKELIAKAEYPLFLLRDLPVDAKRDRLAELSQGIETVLAKALSPAQRQRLSELHFQAQGLPGILVQDRAKALDLTPSQIKQLEKIIGEMPKADNTPASQKKFLDRVLKVLSSDQQTEFARMVGRPFDVSAVKFIACKAPELRDVEKWINSEPLSLEKLRGKVVAFHFWVFGCGNCVNNLPWYKEWHERYADKGLVVLGVHTPETQREHSVDNLEHQVASRAIAYPVAVDNRTANWNAWANHMWPSVYLIDKQGNVRYWWYGELNWEGAGGQKIMQKRIEQLLAERVPTEKDADSRR